MKREFWAVEERCKELGLVAIHFPRKGQHYYRHAAVLAARLRRQLTTSRFDFVRYTPAKSQTCVKKNCSGKRCSKPKATK